VNGVSLDAPFIFQMLINNLLSDV